MKKSILALFVLIPFFLNANKHHENFLKAQELGKQGHYHKALQLYESLQPQGPVTYYNQGVMHYYLKQYGKALAAWHTAELYASSALIKKIEKNCYHARVKLNLSAQGVWYQPFVLLQSYFSLFLLQLLFLLFWLSFCFLCFFPKPFLEKAKPIFLIGSLVSGSLVGGKFLMLNQSSGIIVTNGAKLFAGPNSEFHEVATLQEGERVKVVDQDESWYKMQYRDNKGWIQKSDLKEIKV